MTVAKAPSYPFWKSIGWIIAYVVGAAVASWLGTMLGEALFKAGSLIGMLTGFAVLAAGWREARRRGRTLIMWVLGIFALLELLPLAILLVAMVWSAVN